jgi:hypothetical protein
MNHRCLVCQETAVVRLLDLGPQPISNRFPQRVEDDLERHPFQFGCCRHCGLAQLIKPPPAAMIRPRVDWIRYNEPESHLDDFALRLTELSGVAKDARIVGLTYKEDTTLKRLVDHGYSNCHRFDPAKDWGVSNSCAGLETFQETLTVEWARRLQSPPADVIIARHVLEHMQNPATGVAALKSLVRPGGYLAFEVPDNSRIFSNRDACYLWEEHVTYFTPRTLAATLVRLGLEVLWSYSYPYPVENALVCVTRVPTEHETLTAVAPASREAYDEAAGFVSNFDADRQKTQAHFARFVGETGPIAVFGAGHLAGKFVNFHGVADSIDFVVDDHPNKQHAVMPGNHLPIRPGTQLAVAGIRLVLLSVNPDAETKIIEKYSAECAASMEFASLFRSSPRAFSGLA